MTQKKRTKRLNLDLNDATRSRLEELRKLADSATLTDVVKRALHLYDIVLRHQLDGGDIVLRSTTGEEQKIVFL